MQIPSHLQRLLAKPLGDLTVAELVEILHHPRAPAHESMVDPARLHELRRLAEAERRTAGQGHRR